MSSNKPKITYRMWCAKHRKTEEFTSAIRYRMMTPLGRGCDGYSYTWKEDKKSGEWFITGITFNPDYRSP